MITMKKDNRINLSPALRRFKFFFDLLKKTTDNYIFFADLQENIIVMMIFVNQLIIRSF